MDKISQYNMTVQHRDYKLLYNTLTNSLLCLTNDEYEIVSQYFKKLNLFKNEYPSLYQNLKKAGFVVDKDFDELNFIKLENNRSIYEDQRHHITINPTLDCNLKCWYCSTEFAKAVHHGRMSDELVSAVNKHITSLISTKKIPAIHLDWFGGEPLMYFNEVIRPISKHTLELIEYHHTSFTQHITTNATLITEKMALEMAKLKFSSFQIPIDGNEKHHNSIKFNADNSGTFKTIINNINLT